MERLRLPLLFALVLALGAAAVWLGLGGAPWHRTPPAPLPAELQGIVLLPPQPLSEFQLVDFDGRPLTKQWLHEGWTFVFFGYTHCPDICPTTLHTLQQVRQQLERTPALLADTRFLFISLDPQRDSARILKSYVQYFNPSFAAASGERHVLDRLTTELNVPYVIEKETGHNDYRVNHGAAILLIDDQGRYHARFTPTQNAAQISTSYTRIRAINHR